MYAALLCEQEPGQINRLCNGGNGRNSSRAGEGTCCVVITVICEGSWKVRGPSALMINTVGEGAAACSLCRRSREGHSRTRRPE